MGAVGAQDGAEMWRGGRCICGGASGRRHGYGGVQTGLGAPRTDHWWRGCARRKAGAAPRGTRVRPASGRRPAARENLILWDAWARRHGQLPRRPERGQDAEGVWNARSLREDVGCFRGDDLVLLGPSAPWQSRTCKSGAAGTARTLSGARLNRAAPAVSV